MTDKAYPETSPLMRAFKAFMADYELRGEDDDGREGCYRPNETERLLIEDFVWGLMEDDDWIAASRPAAGSGISDAQIESALAVWFGGADKGLSLEERMRAVLAMAPATTQPAGELTGLHGYLLTQAANARDHQSAECLRDWARALPATTQAQEATHWIRVVDEELVGAHLGVADASDDYNTAKAKLNKLIAWHVAVATDPDVNGGLSLQPVAAAPTQADSAPPSAPCPHCDDTGDVHSIDGQWRGTCKCEAGRAVAPGDEAQVLSQAARDVLAERQRQISAEGWTPDHDDEHGDSSLSMAAVCYVLGRTTLRALEWSPDIMLWPWEKESWKPSDPRRNLTKAGALILAEMERLDRDALRAARAAMGGAKS